MTAITRPVTSGWRVIRSGSEFDHLFPLPNHKDTIFKKDALVKDTVSTMKKIVPFYINDTAKIARLLKKSTLEATCNAIWDFIYTHIQYKLDKDGLEELRRPARSWYDRKSGVDCDDMSMFASSILANLKIDHSFRITSYKEDSWQHVYVVVPNGTNRPFVIDGVISRFNYEKPYVQKMDFPMNLNGMNIAILSGIEGNDLYDVVLANGIGELGAVSDTKELDAIYKNLVSTRNAIAQNPMLVSSNDDPRALLQMLDYAIQYFYTDKRSEALDILAKNESRFNASLNIQQIMGTSDLMDIDDEVLGAVKVKNFFNSIKTAVNTAGKKVAQGAKKAVKTVVKFNPITIVARSGFLVAMRLNIKGMSKKIKWAYTTKEAAKAKGVSEIDWQKAVNALVKVERLFADKLQGKKEALKNAILKGKAGGLSGELGDAGLGEPITAATIAAATPIIIATIKIMKDSGLLAKDVSEDPNSIAQEMASDANGGDYAKEYEKEGEDPYGDNYSAPSALPPSENKSEDKSAKESETKAPDPKDPKKPSTMTKIFDWAKANPLPTVGVLVGSGLLIYTLVKPKPETKQPSLAGLTGTKKKPSTPAKRKTTKSPKKKVRTLLIQ